MNSVKKYNKIIILGNGFDLHANLPSSFDNFFVTCEKSTIEYFLTTSNNINDVNEISIFSLLLYNTYYRKDFITPLSAYSYQSEYKRAFKIEKEAKDWMDVESFIYLFLTSRKINTLKRTFLSIKKSNIYDGFFIQKKDGVYELIYKKVRSEKSIVDFYDFLFDELKIFERRFSNYLNEKVKSSIVYESSAKKIISYLVNDRQDITIINFNYTDIRDFGSFDVINVHGLLDDEIIIGIDNKYIDNNENENKVSKDEIIRFTKTFRKLENQDRKVVLHSEIDEIAIYGHSLGAQDYSYFQSIFDFANLYSGKTVVRFLYSDDFVESSNRYKHKVDMVKKLFDLMSSYGDSLDNKNNGHNIIHKMILEGRLLIEKCNFN